MDMQVMTSLGCLCGTIHGGRFSPYRYVSVEFQERRMQIGHEERTVMTRVVQRQDGGPFLRLAWDLGISVLGSLAADTETRANSCFHEIGS